MVAGDHAFCVHEETVRHMYRIRDFSVVRNYYFQPTASPEQDLPKREEILVTGQGQVTTGPITSMDWEAGGKERVLAYPANDQPLWAGQEGAVGGGLE